MNNIEKQFIQSLFIRLLKQNKFEFPKYHQKLIAPSKHGVYIIREGNEVLHVGNTLRGVNGLQQRLKNHLSGNSSFSRNYLKVKNINLRDNCTYQYLVVEDPRKRALLQALVIGKLCPAHIGLGLRNKTLS